MEVIDVRLNVTFLVVLYAGIYEEVFLFSDNSAKTFYFSLNIQYNVHGYLLLYDPSNIFAHAQLIQVHHMT